MQWEMVFRFGVAALATWRVSYLLVRDDGPWKWFERLRKNLGNGILGQLVRCVPCTSLWVALPFAEFVGGSWSERVVVWLALSGVATWIDVATRPPFEWQPLADEPPPPPA